MIEAGFAALIYPCGLCPRNAFALPLLYEAALHLGDHTENSQDDLPHFAARGNMRVEDRYECVALLTIVNNVEYISGVAPEAIKPRNYKFIAFTQKLDDGF